MVFRDDEYEVIKEYLLGQLTGEHREEFERRYFADDTLYEQLLAGEDELVDEFLTNDLSEQEVAMFHQNFFVGSERQQKLQTGRAMRAYAKAHGGKTRPKSRPSQTRQWSQLFSSVPFRIAAFAVIALVAAIGVWRIFFFESDVDKGLLALNEAYRQQRPLQSRITDVPYAPFITTRGNEPDSVDRKKLSLAELRLLDAKERKPTPEVFHALGKVYLSKKEFDRAIEKFEEALKGQPNNSQIYADLGAAWLEKGSSSSADQPVSGLGTKSSKDLSALARSFEYLNKAVALQNNLPEALFNRAIVLGEQELWKQAADAWNEYLRHDSTSEWAQEARRKLAELQQDKQTRRSDAALVDEFLAAHKLGDNETSWKLLTQTYTSGGSPIAKQLVKLILADEQSESELHKRAFLFLGQLEFERAGDSYHSDLARFYTFLPALKREAVIKLRSQVEDALSYLKTARTEEAIVLLLASKQGFESLGNFAEGNFVEYQLAQSYAVQPNLKKGKEIYAELSTECQRRQYRWLTGQVLVGLAHINIGLNQFSQAIDLSKQALSIFERAGYVEATVRTLRQLAEEYQAVNRVPDSLNLLNSTLEMGDSYVIDSATRWGIYLTISFNLDSLGLLLAAAAYQSEALAIALEMGIPLYTSRSYAFLGATNAKLENFSEAVSNLKQAYEIGATLASDPNGLEMMANSSLQLGDLYRTAKDPAKALDSYNTCLRLYDKLQMPYFNLEAHKGKLLTYAALQDDSATEDELKTTLESLEKFRDTIEVESQRNSFFETQQTVYDLAINFAHKRKHDSRLAFDYSEQSRARSLLASVQKTEGVKRVDGYEVKSSGTPQSMTLDSLQKALPAEVQLLQYAVLNESSLVWIISTNDFEIKEIPIGKSELARKVKEYLSVIAGPSGEKLKAERLGEELHQLLIAPVEALLSRNRSVVIVPDKSLNYLPFITLRSPNSKRYLIEDYEIELSPSANICVTSSRIAATRKSSETETLLSVGNPSFDREAFSNLSDLPSAGREAEAIRSFYKSVVLTGPDAREGLIRKQMKSADVIHFAVHYVKNPKDEMLSELALARERDPHGDFEGRLRVSEIYQMTLPRTRVAVLSACQTGIDRSFDGEGAVSIARPFLAAGVPVVVASLWPVESSSTAELMVRFHKYRTKDSRSTVESLRLAQLDLICQSGEYSRPYYWAPFVAIGGYASF